MSAEYTVSWVIQLEAKNAEQAAIRARKIQLNPRSIATSFDVTEGPDADPLETVDLEDDPLQMFGSQMTVESFLDQFTRDLSTDEVKTIITYLLDRLIDAD